ncbi:hypothetical protein KIN20_007309 [Parelaphostrongylus tenuis]|uniref:Uncharacterized protein n=1 Tax=Parelaphostrongylus tenuis TaxID=148309 RepID=A0AAD5M6B0_PARTN|nr:hypothetical protein KIN20_007309 [Parelaphostrongylus tenuis]
MATWSAEMWQSVVNRVLRIKKLDYHSSRSMKVEDSELRAESSSLMQSIDDATRCSTTMKVQRPSTILEISCF